MAIADVERADAILLVGCDLTEEYPIIWLRVKKAIDRGARLIIMSPWDLEIARWGSHTFVHRAGTEASLLDALSGGLPPAAAAQGAGVAAEAVEAASAALRGAARALVLVGQAALERPDGEAVLDAVDRLRGVLGGADLGVLRGRGNSGGAQLLGLLPDMLPGYRPLADPGARAALEAAWDRPVPAAPGRPVRGMLDAARTGALQVLYVVGADPATEYPDAGAWAEARRRLGVLVVHELFMTRTAAAADVVLPALSFAEKAGTVCNIEGRVQRQDQAVLGPGTARADGQIFSQIAARVGAVLGFSSWQDVFAGIGRIIPGWQEGARLPPPRPRRAPGSGASAPSAAVPEGAVILLTGSRLFDRGTMAVRCPGIRNQAGEPFVALHPDDAGRFGLADGAPCEVRSPRGALRLAVRIWAGLPRGQVYIPRGYEAAPVNALLDDRGPVAVTVRALAAAEAAG